jgi:LuxR family transcriptional regulator, quorum-sensing system regulator CviR
MAVRFKHQLSLSDMSELLYLSEQSLRCHTEEQFKNLVLGLKKLFEFENTICTQADIPDTFLERDADTAVLDISYPTGFTDIYFEKRLHLTDVVFCSALTYLTPLNWSSTIRYSGMDEAYMLAHDFGMKDGWAHCMVDPGTLRCTVFFMAGPEIESHLRTKTILEYITPFYAHAFTKVCKKDSPPVCKLTLKELEVLKWLKEGKSSWEISMILHCSKRVVDFHVSNLKTKLNAMNRAQCLAKAVAYGIVDV